MRLPKALFANTFVLYGLTLALGIVASWQYVLSPAMNAIAPLDLTWTNALVFIAVFVLFTGLLLRFVRFAQASLALFLAAAMVMGAQFIFGAWAPWPASGVLAVIFVVAVWLFGRVLTHDIAIAIGIAGIASLLGLSLTPLIACVLLALMAIYDIISVYRTRHMVALAGTMLSSGAIFGFLVPARPAGFFMKNLAALRQREAMLLGSGDIGLPMVLVASVVPTSIGAAIMVAAFSLAGVMGMEWLFVHQKSRSAMAALPPIAAMAILGYVIATLLGL
ncbi:MAG TPA: presenilin family intramembrane aspartyl protease [Candidatus Paceibacterota bacterium]|nr:presenilin family intramembrane aspartyl protease [Candidatus Paceibacterota bacterium]